MPIILIGGIFGVTGVVSGVVVSFILCVIIIRNVDRIVLRMYKAHLALPDEFSEIREKARVLSNRAGVPMPSIYGTEAPLSGSFIIGKNPNKTALIVPARLSGILTNDELDGMLAHNIVQIDNTIHQRTLAALIAGLFTMTASAIRWAAVFTGFGDYNDPAPKLFGLFIMGLVSPPATTMILSVTKNDYDAQAVSLCGNPAALVSAIECLEKNNVAAYPSLGFLCLVDSQKENFFEHLFNSHPLLEVRLKNLTERGQKV